MKKSLSDKLRTFGQKGLWGIAFGAMLFAGCTSPKEQQGDGYKEPPYKWEYGTRSVKQKSGGYLKERVLFKVWEGQASAPEGVDVPEMTLEELAEIERYQQMRAWVRKIFKLNLNFWNMQDYLDLRNPKFFGEKPAEENLELGKIKAGTFDLKFREDYLEKLYQNPEFNPSLRLDYPRYERDESQPKSPDEKPAEEIKERIDEQKPVEKQIYEPSLIDYNNANSSFEAEQREA